jgi:hypothetical protein
MKMSAQPISEFEMQGTYALTKDTRVLLARPDMSSEDLALHLSLLDGLVDLVGDPLKYVHFEN